jgi:hypothetical protein
MALLDERRPWETLKQVDAATCVRWASIFILTACAIYVYCSRYGHLQELIDRDGWLNVWFWDAKVFANGGEHVAFGRNPYTELPHDIPYHKLPFISAPVVARFLGGLYILLGTHLNTALQLAHLVAIVAAPLILTRLFLGKTWSDAALGYALFLAGIGAFGVTTVIAGNFGAVLYLAIFAGLAHGLTKKNWFWYHIALILAVQVKFPYALLWIVPVLVNGWSWAELRNSIVAALAAAVILAVTSYIDPVYFRSWIDALTIQVNGTGDLGFSIFGVTRWMVGLDVQSILPYALHIAFCLPLLVFLMLDPTKGPMKAAALVVFAILANPRMKEYDIAFATIPTATLLLHAFARYAPRPHKTAIALAGLLATMLIDLKLDRLIDAYVYPLTMALAVLSLWVIRNDPERHSPVVPVRFFDRRTD